MSKELKFQSMILQVNSTMNYYFTIFCVWFWYDDTYNALGLCSFNGFF